MNAKKQSAVRPRKSTSIQSKDIDPALIKWWKGHTAPEKQKAFASFQLIAFFSKATFLLAIAWAAFSGLFGHGPSSINLAFNAPNKAGYSAPAIAQVDTKAAFPAIEPPCPRSELASGRQPGQVAIVLVDPSVAASQSGTTTDFAGTVRYETADHGSDSVRPENSAASRSLTSAATGCALGCVTCELQRPLDLSGWVSLSTQDHVLFEDGDGFASYEANPGTNTVSFYLNGDLPTHYSLAPHGSTFVLTFDPLSIADGVAFPSASSLTYQWRLNGAAITDVTNVVRGLVQISDGNSLVIANGEPRASYNQLTAVPPFIAVATIASSATATTGHSVKSFDDGAWDSHTESLANRQSMPLLLASITKPLVRDTASGQGTLVQHYSVNDTKGSLGSNAPEACSGYPLFREFTRLPALLDAFSPAVVNDLPNGSPFRGSISISYAVPALPLVRSITAHQWSPTRAAGTNAIPRPLQILCGESPTGK